MSLGRCQTVPMAESGKPFTDIIIPVALVACDHKKGRVFWSVLADPLHGFSLCLGKTVILRRQISGDERINQQESDGEFG